MFKCSGICKDCGKCQNVYGDKILKEIHLPADFVFEPEKGKFGIAFDIGTTTIAAALWSLETGELLGQKGADNPQRRFGADVLSRIAYCVGNHERIYQLQHPLRMTLRSMILELGQDIGISIDKITKVTFCGNTAMMLLFAGMSIDGIASYPFQPDYIDGMFINSRFDNYNITGYMLPNIGGHIGGDISAGLISTRLAESTENALFIDIGTNGEILLKAKEKLYGFSTAAGPAFEGANITCGMPATDGAIEKFELKNDDVLYNTIGEGLPKGICGSGIISAISEMLKNDIIDFDGKLCSYETFTRMHPFSTLRNRILDDTFVLYFNENGENITISQKDIREFQLAKAAISAGITIIMEESGVNLCQIEKLFLAGGFGINTPVDTLVQIGILPNLPTDKIELVGNAALAGASMVLMSEKEKSYCQNISRKVKRIELNSMDKFQEKFIEALKFTTNK